ncbi:MAG: helix-turn-helix transcriptional regulator [Dehalococcoidia bacterium]|nr:helix-turn-helix transcriptional regulator [Dehalococcoidia bacterium]
MTDDATSESPRSGRPRLHGELLQTSLLAFLKNWNAYGYELTQRLAEAGMPEFDSGTVYRTLRQLEKSGFVSSFWDTSESGPARRRYSLTGPGELWLNGWLATIENYQAVLQNAMKGFTPPANKKTTENEGE